VIDYTIEIAAIPEQYVACLRARGPIGDLGARMARLAAFFEAAGIAPAGAPQARFYDDEYDPDDTDFEVCLPLRPDDAGWTPDTVGDAVVSITPAHHAMATTHVGGYETIAAAHAALRRELDMLGYTQAGPASETYVHGPMQAATSDEYLTVVCYPYAR